jgi:hypothetical protein
MAQEAEGAVLNAHTFLESLKSLETFEKRVEA